MRTSPLIQVEELAGLLAGRVTEPSSEPVLLDVRFRMVGATGRLEYERAHIPGASYVDMDTELATIRPDGVGGRHPMPTVETFTAAMRSAGVIMARPVVAYDDWASIPASRLWWMLRHLGFVNVQVLDGGIGAWIAAKRPTESGPGAPGVGDFSPAGPGIGRLLDANDAIRYAARHVLLDARAADRFRGENETIDPVAGHIPGAVSAPAPDNVDSSGRFLPAEELAGRLRLLAPTAATGTTTADTMTADTMTAVRVGAYCGSGIQATHLALALSVAGITHEADVYIGSWSDWLNDPARPIEV